MKELVTSLIPEVENMPLDLVEEGIIAFMDEEGGILHSDLILPHLINQKLKLNEKEY
jgi:hypothetical protein